MEPVVKEVWEMAELSLPKLKIQTIGMLSMEWLERQELSAIWPKRNGICRKLAQEKWDMQETGSMPSRSIEIDKIFSD